MARKLSDIIAAGTFYLQLLFECYVKQLIIGNYACSTNTSNIRSPSPSPQLVSVYLSQAHLTVFLKASVLGGLVLQCFLFLMVQCIHYFNFPLLNQCDENQFFSQTIRQQKVQIFKAAPINTSILTMD